MALLVMAAFAAGFVASECGDDTTCEEVIFADENLEAAVRDAIDKPSGTLCIENVEELTVLSAYGDDLQGGPIVDLDGIQALTSLAGLYDRYECSWK